MTKSYSSPSFRPLYEQIKLLLMQSLMAGEWGPGEMIPSEIELAGRFSVSQGTVRKAIDELAAENILVRRQGKGTFVSTHTEERTRFRFLRLMPDDGVRPTPERRLVDCRRGKASAEVARALGLRAGAAVVIVTRLLIFSGTPVVLDEICLPATLFKGLSATKIAEFKGPMYGLFETEYGVRMIRAEERIKAVTADEAAAALLQVPPGSPLLSVERVAFTYGDQPVEWRRGLCVTERFHYANKLG